LGTIEDIKAYKVTRTTTTVKLLLVGTRENALVFALIDYSLKTNQFTQSNQSPTFYNYNKETLTKKPNFLMQTLSKLIRLKLMSERKINENGQVVFEFWLIFENNCINHMDVTVSPSDNEISIGQVRLINDTVELKFNASAEGKKVAESSSSEFKMTRQVFFSNDGSLVYQVSDYTKRELVDRKVTQLELNLYRIKCQAQLIEAMMPTSCGLIESGSNLDLCQFYKKSNERFFFDSNKVLSIFCL
jgi:hypothetical protein